MADGLALCATTAGARTDAGHWVWEQQLNLGISRAVASAPALMCFRFIGTVLFLWISLFEQFWFGSMCLHLLVASGMRLQEQGLSPPVFAWGLPD